MDKLNLVLNEPIRFHDICTIYQPTIRDIVIYGKDRFDELIMPFTVSTDLVNLPEEQKVNIKSFDLLFLPSENGDKYLFNHNGRSFLEMLVESLSFYCKESIEFDPKNVGFKIGKNKSILNRDNFDEFSDIIFEINTKERPKVEKMPEFKNERQRDIWLKLQEGRKKKQGQDVLSIETIINIIMYGCKSFISPNQIKEMTMWQLINTYKSILEIEQYQSNFKIMLTGMGSKELDLKHWTEKLKL